jgi:hypothetical protein
MERPAAREDPRLMPYHHKSPVDLQMNSSFYEAMIDENANYDRSLLIKLAMTLKCELIIQGLVEELDMTERNKALLVDANSKYPAKDCEKGLELLLTWRHAPETKSSRRDGSKLASSTFEIRVKNNLLARIEEATMGRDFMRHFVSEDPVSPKTKAALADSFAAFISSPDEVEDEETVDESSSPHHHPVRSLRSAAAHILKKTKHLLHKVKQSVIRRDRRVFIDRRDHAGIFNRQEEEEDYWSEHPYYIHLSDSPVWNKIYGRIFHKIDKLEKIWHALTRPAHSDQIQTDRGNSIMAKRLTWTKLIFKLFFQQNNLPSKSSASRTTNLLSRRSRMQAFLFRYGSSFVVEAILTLFVILYFCLLIVISLPPALRDKGASTLRKAVRGGIGAVRMVKQRSLQHMRNAMMQSTQSLTAMVRNRSSESLYDAIIDH